MKDVNITMYNRGKKKNNQQVPTWYSEITV